MKWLILVLLVASCATKDKTTETANGQTSATESESKPVSPYTVEPCYCMKIFKPVCANGQSYGNSCEAECQGNKTWTEGSCAETKK